MNFLYPQFLWALLAISIPIIIHLFNFKRFKKIYFSDLQLLKEVEMETSKKSNLKHVLILLSRILAIAALVFAFAQPYFPKNNKTNAQGEKIISIYLDNSLSMNNVSQEFTLLDKAKEQAENIAGLYLQSDKFQLITNDFEQKHQRFVTQQELLDMIQEVEVSSSSRLLSEVEQKQKDFLNKTYSANKIGYYISDFQKTSTDIDKLKIDSTISTRFVHLKPEFIENVWIDTVWFETPIRVLKKKEKLFARINNNTKEDIQIKIELFLNGNSEGFLNQDVMANSFSEISMNYSVNDPGVVHAKLKITEYPNPVSTFDDDFYFSYLLDKSSQILVINENTSYMDNSSGNINQLFKNDTYFHLKNVNAGSIDYSQFGNSNVIVLNGLNSVSSGLVSEIMKYTEAGGTVVYFPGSKINIASVNELLLALESGRFLGKDTSNTKVNYLNFQHPLFKDVFGKIPKNMDLPVVSSHFQHSVSTRSRIEKLMKLQNGDNFLSKINYKKGNVYVYAVPLDKGFSNLTGHSLFVTSLLRIAENSGSKQVGNQLISEDYISIKDKGYKLESIHIENKELGIDFIPDYQRDGGDVKLYFSDRIIESGNYEIKKEKEIIGGFGLNYDRMESDFESYSVEDLTNEIGSAIIKIVDASSSQMNDIESKQLYEKETKWWKLFILLALLFVAIEILLIKGMK